MLKTLSNLYSTSILRSTHRYHILMREETDANNSKTNCQHEQEAATGRWRLLTRTLSEGRNSKQRCRSSIRETGYSFLGYPWISIQVTVLIAEPFHSPSVSLGFLGLAVLTFRQDRQRMYSTAGRAFDSANLLLHIQSNFRILPYYFQVRRFIFYN